MGHLESTGERCLSVRSFVDFFFLSHSFCPDLTICM